LKFAAGIFSLSWLDCALFIRYGSPAMRSA
jgi:hypothetical protein